MEITLHDFNVLSAEQSRREVRIAKLEMELHALDVRHAGEMEVVCRERDELWAENTALRERLSLLEADYENVRFENHWMKQYILLSVERVKDFFAHIRDFTVLSAIKSFVMDMLPPNASAEQIAYARDVMQLPMRDEVPAIAHADQVVVTAEAGAQVVYSTSNPNEGGTER